jgi:hypothetical protein
VVTDVNICGRREVIAFLTGAFLQLFLACLRDLQSHKLLTEIDREKLFSNITEILDSNVMFWRNTLFPLIRDMRQRRRTTCIENMLEGVLVDPRHLPALLQVLRRAGEVPALLQGEHGQRSVHGVPDVVREPEGVQQIATDGHPGPTDAKTD